MLCVVADCDEATPAWVPLMLTDGSIVVVDEVVVSGCVCVAVLPDALLLVEPLMLLEAVSVEELGELVGV